MRAMQRAAGVQAQCGRRGRLRGVLTYFHGVADWRATREGARPKYGSGQGSGEYMRLRFVGKCLGMDGTGDRELAFGINVDIKRTLNI